MQVGTLTRPGALQVADPGHTGPASLYPDLGLTPGATFPNVTAAQKMQSKGGGQVAVSP